MQQAEAMWRSRALAAEAQLAIQKNMPAPGECLECSPTWPLIRCVESAVADLAPSFDQYGAFAALCRRWLQMCEQMTPASCERPIASSAPCKPARSHPSRQA
jgi:hypothetical protein